ncbi:hypothetical protein SAV31267_091970 [Streptomyces avermitilis]|uniref:Uncharacterized protein n=1 Tax=Streptomyces avermitilis TaxID=33903 RepID=A0A4D4N591_STRAX|nr:hypothetical protein SAV31267_091970 [Streptomyces avermitilis]
MESLTGVVAVIGTLLGVVVSHVLQTRAAERLHAGALNAETRRELRQATARLLACETSFRRLQYNRWGRRDADVPEKDAAEAAALEARSGVIAALAEVQLLTDNAEIRERLAELADATFTLHYAADEEDLATRAARVRASAGAVVDTVGRVVRS